MSSNMKRMFKLRVGLPIKKKSSHLVNLKTIIKNTNNKECPDFDLLTD